MLVWPLFFPFTTIMSKNETGFGPGDSFTADETTKFILNTADSKIVELLEAHTTSSILLVVVALLSPLTRRVLI